MWINPLGMAINTLTPGRRGCHFEFVFFKHSLDADISSISHEIAFR